MDVPLVGRLFLKCFILQLILFCLASSSFNFDGQTIAYYDATYMPLHNKQDELRLRFKTNYPNGVLFYAKGTQNNDYLNIELRNGSIFVAIDLGSTPEHSGETLIQAGSVLDDYQWHDLAIIRYMKNISVKIDQTIVRAESLSAFNGLDLDGKVRSYTKTLSIRLLESFRSLFIACLFK